MLKLLTCAQGHYWEISVEDGSDEAAEKCPVCGHCAETMPLLELAPTPAESSAPAEPVSPPPLRDKEGRPVIAGYEILDDLGKSPTGVHLYKARQVLVNRTVVLKVVTARDDPGQFAWGSLRGEATALGRLTHPHIVQILEAGERERQLFYNAVEWIEGPTLADYLQGKPQPLRQAVALIETLARTVHYAHEKNILHRNLKPASILLCRTATLASRGNDTRKPGATLLADPIPKIMDFGLARRPVEGDPTDVELQGELPCYLAPEQGWGRAKEIGPATDVYALGAILYELIAGRPPFRESTTTETLDAVQCREPPALSRFRSGVPGDLDAICRKCLAKQPRRRYASALDLAEDLRRCSAGLPVKARDAGAAERLGKWLRRNGRTLALLMLGLCVGAALSPSIRRHDDRATSTPRERNNQHKPALLATIHDPTRLTRDSAYYVGSVLMAQRAIEQNQLELAQELLSRCPSDYRQWEWAYLSGRVSRNLGVSELETEAAITCMHLSPDGKHLAIGGKRVSLKGHGVPQGEIAVWNVATRRRLWQKSVAGEVRSVAVSPNGASLAAVRLAPGGVRGSALEVRAFDGGELLLAPWTVTQTIGASVVYSDDSQHLLVIGEDGKVRGLNVNKLFEASATEPLFPPARQRGVHARLLPIRTFDHLHRFAVTSPDGMQLKIVDTLRPPPREELHGHTGGVQNALAYDPRNDRLAAGGTGKTIAVWDLRMPSQPPLLLRGHTGAVTSLAFTSDGQRLASCAEDGTVRIWDVRQGLELLTLSGYASASTILFQSIPDPFQPMPDATGRWPDRLLIGQKGIVTIVAPPPRDPGPFHR